jgi:hypothetical protein
MKNAVRHTGWNPRRIATVSLRVAIFILVSQASLCLAQDRNQSTAKVKVAVKGGRLIVDRGQSRFQASALFKEKYRDYQDAVGRSQPDQAEAQLRARVEKALFDDLDRCFGMTSQLYWWLLTPDQRNQDSAGSLNDPLTALRNFTGTYPKFKEALEKAIVARGDAFVGQQQVAFQAITRQLGDDPISLETKTALILDFGSDDVFAVSPFDSDAGTIDFRVADPILNTDYQVTVKDAGCGAQLVADRADIVEILKGLEGGLWRSAEIRSLLEGFYSNLGYEATISLSEARAEQKTIEIEESPRITRIVFPCSATQLCSQPDLLDQAVYLLLPDPAFRAFIRKGRPFADILDASGKPEFKTLQLPDLLASAAPGSCPEPYLNLLKLQTQQLQLGQIGLAVAQAVNVDRSAGGVTFVDLQVQKTTNSGAAGSKTPENVTRTGAPGASQQGFINPHEQAPERQPGFTPIPQLPRNSAPSTTADNLSRPENKKDVGWEPDERKNFVGGGFQYRPGQNVRLFALYQRSQLFTSDDSLSVQAGGNGSALGSVNYFVDYLFFGALHRRLSLQMTAGSDNVASRQLAGLTVDQRQTGGSARFELELFRDLRGFQLRFFAEGERSTVELKDETDATTKVNLTTLDVGALYFHRTEGTRRPRTTKFEPRLRLGLGMSSTEPSFKVFSVKGDWHQKLQHLFELDFAGQFAVAGESTPLFEQPSLGGAESVRGFRTDDAIGRRLWSLQSEFWTPIPGLKSRAESLAEYLKRNVRIAAFLDLGGIYETSFSESGTRAGPGVGLRIIRFPVVIKLDWAYGLGRGISGSGHGKFYFSLTSNLPF